MIGYLKGKILSRSGFCVVLQPEQTGVGYEVFVPEYEIQGQDSLSLWVYTHVKEDALALYGFGSSLDREVFLALLKVSGVGPKLALHILSYSRGVGVLSRWVEDKNIKAFSAVPKVGKKKAEQIILQLQGTLSKLGGAQASSVAFQVQESLKKLGFNQERVNEALKYTEQKGSFEEKLKESLLFLGNKGGVDVQQ